jgi:CheY-like chemotaxis protein
MLKRLQVAADVVENGAEAVAAVRANRYDCVLMDCHMPVMNGLDAARAIRTLYGDGSRTPIIAVTADAMPEQREAIAAAGMVDILLKPFRFEDLAAVLQRWSGDPISNDPR